MGMEEIGSRAPGKNWGKGRTKKFKFKEAPKKSDLELKEIKKLLEQYDNYDSSKVKSFRDVPLSKKTFYALKEGGFTKPTDIQKESIGLALRGLDILGAAKTGSGKTLAFLIPVLELLNQKLWTKMDGLGALIITPTRELAYQIFETLKKVGAKHDYSAGLIIGGKDLKFERKRMNQMNIIICTPGRLLQHMDENPMFDCSNLQILVLDEADRCLDMGFEQTMNAIIANLPAERQTLLFSATQTKSVKDLARLSLKSPVYVSVHENSQYSTPESLQQSYVVCPLESKLDMLWSFLKHHKKSKILVFLSSCKQVRFMHMLFCRMRPGMSLLALYGSLHQLKRMTVYEDFCKKQSVVLFATDIAARGLDFPSVDWVIQLDCPEDATTYIHRAGRTARYNKGGEALLVLLPSEEEAMIEQLDSKKIPINKIEVNPKKIMSVRRRFDALLARDSTLKECAQRAFKAYLKSVFLMKNKKVFDVTKLDLPSFASSLGLAVAPRVRFLQKRLEGKLKTEKKHASVAGSDDDEDVTVKEEPESDAEQSEDTEDKVQQPKLPIFDFSIEGEDEDDCDDLFVGKKSVEVEGDENLDDLLMPQPSKGKTKAKSKAAVAKKLAKKKILSNKKVLFDDDGEAVPDLRREQQSELAKAYEQENVSGINIERAREILKLEDQVDKKLERERVKAKHKAARRKAKLARKGLTAEEAEAEAEEVEAEGQPEAEVLDRDYSSGSEPDLSWLPDPEKVYGKGEIEEEEDDDGMDERPRTFKRKTQDADSEDEYRGQVVNTSDESSSEDEQPVRNLPILPKKKKRKRPDVATQEDDDDNSNNEEMDEKLMEELALKLLSKR